MFDEFKEMQYWWETNDFEKLKAKDGNFQV